MSLLRRLAVACGAWLVCCGASAAAVDTLEDCAAHASPQSRGIVALEVDCPGLELALREAGFVDILPSGWRDNLNRDALRDLGNLAHRYADVPTQRAPDPGALRAVLDQLAREQVKPATSWWDAVRDWLRSWLQKQDAGSTHWMDRLLDRLGQSASLIKTITYVLLGLVLVGAILFIVKELRTAGVLSRRRGVKHQHDAAAALRTDDTASDIVDMDAVALRDQPAALLRLLVARLLANGQLQAERSLTHRELATRSAFADADSRMRFERVTQLAERVLYGSEETNVSKFSAVIADGRRLLSQLQVPGLAQS